MTAILLTYQQNWKEVEVRISWDKTPHPLPVENILKWSLFLSAYLKLVLQHYQEERSVIALFLS